MFSSNRKTGPNEARLFAPLLAVFLGVLLTACASQRIDLQPASPDMLQAVQNTAGLVYDGSGQVKGKMTVSIGSASALYREWARSALFAGAPVSGGNPCNSTAASALEVLGYEADQIRAVRYDLRASRTSEGNTRIQGVNAWVTFKNRPGYVVISMNQTCRLMTYYTRAGAELPSGV